MLRRMGQAIEVARPTLFLLSDDASFITGTTLMVDGGYCSLGPEGLGNRRHRRFGLNQQRCSSRERDINTRRRT